MSSELIIRPSTDARGMNASAAPIDRLMSGRLPHIGVIRFAGADAVAFLQGQLSNDTRRLASGSALLAAYSTPQGRVVALLRLLPHSTGVLALLPREIVLPTIERLRKFVLRAKVQIEDVSDHILVLGHHGAEELRAAGLPVPADDETSNSAQTYVEHNGIGMGRVRADGDRYWVVSSAADLAQSRLLYAGSDADGDDTPRNAEDIELAWRHADVRSGSPQVYAATREMFVAQMLNLDLLDGISFTKGCFTGQEIIARTQHLGRIKRRMFRLRLPEGTWAVGQAVHLRDGRSGRLTEVAPSTTAVEALAVLTLDPAAPNDTDSVAGTLIDAVELALPYALTDQKA